MVFHQKDRLTALYPEMSEFMIHRNVQRQCGDDSENCVKKRTIEQSLAEDIKIILEEVTTRTRTGSSMVDLKTRFDKTWKDPVDKNPKENSNSAKYKYTNLIRKCHICQSTTHLANTCPKRGKINKIDIEKEPDVEKDGVIEERSYDKSINVTFGIIESYSNLPQLSNHQLYLSKIQDAQLIKNKPRRKKGYKASNFCIIDGVINKKPTKLLLDPGFLYPCVGNYVLRNFEPNFEDQFLPIDGT
ncbi:hypothetical protein O181_088577 [Austropuccinia psidii MF-1]|uniref:Uncharacterized protein n=1 Tax=Austropuccinia psidii MF-1 TaxID=1389203 RepID=A0A9Q3IRS8_9BASI|nr:hypothetical protein [Austropuccinia psidii MF-1]